MENHSDKCKRLVCAIQGLSVMEQEELFKLLFKNKCDYTQNSNGIFINLSWSSNEILDIIEQFINFCICSQNELNKVESHCKELELEVTNEETPIVKTKYKFKKEVVEDDKEIKNKVSSSMRFYLLRKRFLKNNAFTINHEDQLIPEENN